MSDFLDITVLMGGPSFERAVSLQSGAAIAGAMERRGHRVVRADITPADTKALDRPEAELFFIALHGDFGESGQVQQLCEERGLRYTGSGPRASRLGMQKAASKQIFKRRGLATPDWMVIEKFHSPANVRRWLEEIPPPVVVKPVDGGSSLDVSICRSPQARDAALEELVDFYGRAMIERFVPGREITVGILGDLTLPPLEVRPAAGFYDYHAKYDDDAGTEYSFDLDLPAAVLRRLADDARTAFDSLDCRDFARVDFILDEQGSPQVLEINTIPGFTSHSLLPKAAEQAGIGFDELCDRIARFATRRALLAG